MKKWKYLKGCEKDFNGAPEWATIMERFYDSREFFVERHDKGGRYQNAIHGGLVNKFPYSNPTIGDLIAIREPVTDEQDLNECIGATEATINGANLNDIDGFESVKYNQYLHEIKPGIFIDVYDVLMAWNVTNPALQHLIKKALQAGDRGHKSREQDLQDIIDSAIRAKELEIK